MLPLHPSLNPVQPKNSPFFPFLTTIPLPHFGHLTGAPSTIATTGGGRGVYAWVAVADGEVETVAFSAMKFCLKASSVFPLLLVRPPKNSLVFSSMISPLSLFFIHFAMRRKRCCA